ncbi:MULTISPECIES: branched-chain amino acid ABC transporter permease [unclassified Limnohabitans]|jgi:ABC-type branched-subunit amino acid transport system permease subunit|uniref:branched-chain amino acid ABC transporter permease n=1 Tax=unclassified Limnohabitans TaxID=2626134 RepID=UPI000D3A6004|nr:MULTISPECIES: branched-chain amino acid ABC transporter permease [unclassified Limnohabitans]PUE20439.1 branched-chain amino acid ABC transporter permease [Limnohabitans sp. MMS-10A-192]PUE25173.1 branched-chain amino acid ABC transporter permease [Limnohabitans sp. MMS-10A-160]
MAKILGTSVSSQEKPVGQTVLWAAGIGLALALAGTVMPKWLTFLITMAAANGLVSLGIVVLMRGGVVPFGQGMVFAVGGYAAALMFNKLGITDALLLTLCGGVVAALVAAPFAPLLSRYRGIFFAMLTLALSMVTYGLLMKLEVLGGSDGFNLGRPTLLGQKLPDAQVGYIMYVLTISVSTVMALLARIYFDSTRGLITVAAKENELRVEYLGGSVRHAMAINFILAAFCGGLGGALAVMALGHIEPNFSFWTTSGEFVFVAILGGWQSVIALFVASTVLEVVRSFSSAYFPNTWQMALGIFLLIVIRFLPRGIGSLWVKGGTR